MKAVAARPARTWIVSTLKRPVHNADVDAVVSTADGGLSVYEKREALTPYLGVWVDPQGGHAWHLYSDYPAEHHKRHGWVPAGPSAAGADRD